MKLAAAAVLVAMSVPLDSSHWALEHDATSTAQFTRVETSGIRGLVFRYQLGAGRPLAQFAALVASVSGGLAQYGRVTFTARADRPMRILVELRPVGHDNPPRWQRSVYLDRTTRTVTVFFDDLHPMPSEAAARAPLPSIGALMFVVDTNNTRPGTHGEITLTEVAYGR